MDYTPGQLKLLAYWGTIQSAVTQRSSTAELWASVRGAAQIDGVTLSGVSATDMNSLRATAAGMRNAATNLASARPNQGIDATMIAQDISARPLGAQNAAPAWLVRFEHDITVGGVLQTVWRTSTFEGVLPPTKNDLLNQVTNDALAMADDYGVTHVGVGSMQISAV